MLRSLGFAAALALVSAQDGPGTNGRFCGNYLGAQSALVDPLKGKGSATFGDYSFPIAINASQIIITTVRSVEGRDFITKMTECMYAVQVDFADNALKLVTGPPSAAPDQKRCWRFSKEGDTVSFQVKALSGEEEGSIFDACPTGAEDPPMDVMAGSIGNFADLPTSPEDSGDYYMYSNACPPPSEQLAPYTNGIDIRGPGLWVQPGFVAMTTDLREAGLGWQVSQACIVALKQPAANDPLLAEGQIPAGIVLTSTANPAVPMLCMGVTFNVASGLAIIKRGTTLPTFAEDGSVASGCPQATYADNNGIIPISVRGLSPDFKTAFDAMAAALPKVPTVPAGQLRAEKREVVETTLTMSAPADLTVATATNPCSLFGIRVALAKAAGVDVETVKLTLFTLGNFVMQLAGDAPANLIKSACPAASNPANRLLREEGSGLARALQAPQTLTAGVQVITTGQSGFTLQTAVAAAASTAGQATIASVVSASLGVSVTTTGVSNPTVSTATVLARPLPLVRPQVYTPSFDIKTFHMIPRFVLMGGGKASSTFEPTLDYAQGALFPAGGIIAFGVVFFLLYGLIYVCSCLCRCCCTRCRTKRDPDTYYTGCRKNCGTPRAMVVMGLINIGLLLACIGYLPRFGDGIDQLFSASKDFSNVLKNTGALMGDRAPFTYNGVPNTQSMYYATGIAKDGATLIRDGDVTTTPNRPVLSTPPTPQTLRDIIDALITGAGAARTASDTVGTTMKDTGSNFGDILDKIDVDVIKAQTTMAGYAVLGILSFLLILWSILVCKNSFAACLYKASSPLIILLVLLVTILAGAYYAVGIIGADVCVDPAAALGATMNFTGITGMPADSLDYYLNCAADPYMAPKGAYKQIMDAKEQIDLAAAQVKDLEAQVSADVNNAAFAQIAWDYPTKPGEATVTVPKLKEIATAMEGAANATAAVARDQVSCAAIDAIMQKLYIGLCNDGFGTVIAIFRIIMAASVLLICQLGVGVDVCCYHPGDSSAWGGAEDKSVELTVRQPQDGSNGPVAGGAPMVASGASKV